MYTENQGYKVKKEVGICLHFTHMTVLAKRCQPG